MKVGPFTFTRDSALWWVSAVLSLAAFAATLSPNGNPNDPASLAFYGIPDRWLPYIRLLAFINVWVSGKMAHSPLPSSEAANRVRLNGGQS